MGDLPKVCETCRFGSFFRWDMESDVYIYRCTAFGDCERVPAQKDCTMWERSEEYGER